MPKFRKDSIKESSGMKHRNEETTWIGFNTEIYSISRTSDYKLNINNKDGLELCDIDQYVLKINFKGHSVNRNKENSNDVCFI